MIANTKPKIKAVSTIPTSIKDFVNIFSFSLTAAIAEDAAIPSPIPVPKAAKPKANAAAIAIIPSTAMLFKNKRIYKVNSLLIQMIKLDRKIVYINLIFWAFSIILLLISIKYGFIFLLFPFIFWFGVEKED